jgi:exopolysaccharide production protein ExoZ
MFTNLQVGRIVAASLVLVFHVGFYGWYVLGTTNPMTGPTWAYWFRTTVVFLFALSGFVLAHSFQKTTLRGFVWHRLLRLFPTYWVALLIVLAFWYAFNPPPFGRRNLFYAFALWPAGPNKAASILHVEWTLVYELFLSLAIVPLAACGRRRGLGFGVGIWLLLCLGNQIIQPGGEPPWHPRAVELPLSVVNVPFLLGVLIYLAPRPRGWLRWIALVIAAVALPLGGKYVESAQNLCYLLQSLAAALLVSFLTTGRQLSAKNPLVIAGDWSYGVYLLHASILFGFFTLLWWWGVEGSAAIVVGGGILAFALSLLFGVLENRGSRRLRKWLVRKPAIPAPVPVPSDPPLSRAA